MDVERPAKLIDVSKLPLDQVEETAGGNLRIGALVASSGLAYHPLVEQRYPMLSSALTGRRASSSCAAWPRWAETCCNARAVPISPRLLVTPCNRRTPGSGCGRRSMASTA